MAGGIRFGQPPKLSRVLKNAPEAITRYREIMSVGLTEAKSVIEEA
jgi:ribosomal protein L7/L12